MRAAIAPALVAATVVFLAWAPGTASAGELPKLQPYQMARSLQLVQDRIANGDHAALPMQKKLMEMIDRRLGEAGAGEFSDRRNFDALMIYAMSGGDPRTVEIVAAKLDLDQHDSALTNGLSAYFRSDPGKAGTLLASVDPAQEAPSVGAYLALIKGSIRSLDNPQDGLALLDEARLLAPGSLVEEAALRRSIKLAAATDDPERFLRASEQYVRRFLNSPYASHFADAFINGVIDLQDRLDRKAVEAIVARMNDAQRSAIYLRIARRSAILGYAELSGFASSRAVAVSAEEPSASDPRAEFYNVLATVTTGPASKMADRLARIDRKTLSRRDVQLLDAAIEVVKGMLAPPLDPSAIKASAALAPNDANAPSPDMASPAANVGETPLLPQDPAGEAATEDLPDQEILSVTRKKLQEIDMLLEGNAK